MKRNAQTVNVSVDPEAGRPMEKLDMARRQADLMGYHGIQAKRGQSNRTYRRRGYLRLRFPTRGLARDYVRRLERLNEPAISWRFVKSPNPFL